MMSRDGSEGWVSSQRKLAAIMFTDMVGYTSLGQRNESLSLALVEEHRKLIRPVLARHEGKEVKTIGDAFLVQFSSAVDAVRCAYDIQRVIREFNLSLAEQSRIHLRIGIHVGDIFESQGDISGDAVNVASRIEALASDGGVCLTSQVYEIVMNKVDIPMKSLGSKNLKNVNSPTEVYKMVMPWQEENAVDSARRFDAVRVAVLPFASMSPDPGDEYFADGLTEELIDKLCQIRGLEVIARTSIMNYKKKEKNASEIGKELKVGSLVEGSIRKVGNKIRVTAQLIDASTEGHLWSSHYDKNLDDIFAVQSDIAEKVAEELKIRLLEQEKRIIEKRSTENTEAYTYFLRGMQLVSEPEEEKILHARQLFERAVSLDSGFARAFEGLAKCYFQLGNNGYILWNDAIEHGRTAARKALELDPDLAEAHCVNAMIMFMADENPNERYDELQRALKLNPNLAEAYVSIAFECGARGDLPAMVATCEKAYLLDPSAPRTIRLLGTTYFYAGREGELLDHSRKTLQLDPYGTYRYLFDYYASKGDYENAEQMVEKLESLGPTLEYTYLNRGYLAAKTGDKVKAKEMIDKLDSTHKSGWARSSSAGLIYFALGDADKFFEYMFRSLDDHTLPVPLLRYNPLLKAVRKDPRFAEIIRKAGLEYNLDE